MLAELNPIQMLRDDLNHEDIEIQKKAVEHLKLVARVVGPTTTQTELLPIIEEYCFSDVVENSVNSERISKEEISADLAKILDDEFFDSVGGSEMVGQLVLPILEKLAALEETAIRDNAVEALCKNLGKMREEDVQTYAFDTYVRLCSGDWFSSRVSAAGITAGILAKVTDPERLAQVLKYHEALIRDDMPMVRREAYTQLPNIIKVTDLSFYESHGKTFLRNLDTKVTDSNIRVLLVKILVCFLEELPKKGMSNVQLCHEFQPWLQKLAVDDSWRIRNEFAEQLEQIVESFKTINAQTMIQELLPLGIKILADTEPHVREAAIKNFHHILGNANVEGVESMITERLAHLAEDQNDEVREVVSKHFVNFFKISNLPANVLQSIVLRIKDDEQPACRLNLCMSLHDIYQLLDINSKRIVLDLVNEWKNDAKWRTREAIIQNVGGLAEQMGLEEFLNSILQEYLVASLTDPAFDVRLAACQEIKKISETYGLAYFEQHVADYTLTTWQDNKNYLHRMIVFKLMEELIEIIEKEDGYFDTNLMRIYNAGLGDEVPNVRICALISLLKYTESGVLDADLISLKPLLVECTKDTDNDVKYYSTRCLANIS